MHLTQHRQGLCIGASIGIILLIAFLAKNNGQLAKACLVNLTLGLLILAGFPHLALPGCLPYEKGLTATGPDDLAQYTLGQTYRLANRIVAFRNRQSTN
jgi:hypothetical protein